LFDKAFGIEVLFQFFVGNLDGFPGFSLVDEDITSVALLSGDLEVALMRIEVCTQVRVIYLDLVAQRLRVHVYPTNHVACVVPPIIVFYFLWIDAYRGGNETAQMFLRDRRAKLVLKPNRIHSGLLQSHPITIGAGPRIEHLSQTRFNFAIAGAQIHTFGQVKNQFLPDESIQHLRAIHLIDRTRILTARPSLSLRDLLAKVCKSVFEVPNGNLVTAYLGDGGIAAGSTTQHFGSAA